MSGTNAEQDKTERERLAALLSDAYKRAPWGVNAFEAQADALIASGITRADATK